MKTAVIYARYSSDRQTEQSIEGQLRVCNDYASKNNIIVIDTYIDRAMTGTNDNRAEFQRMIKDCGKKAWDLILVYKLDRFSRNKYEMAMHKKTLRDNGIKLVSAMENIPDTPEGIILESLLEGMAEYYSAELSQKVKRGMNESRHKGQYLGGYIPYGYRIVDKKYEIVPEQAEIVRLIYNRYANDVYVKDILKELADKGITNGRGKPFTKNVIHRILLSERYVGIYRFGDEVFANTFPRIIDDAVFEIVQKKNKGNKYGSRSPDVTYILRKKIKCGYCGRTINGITGTSKTGKVNRYYACSGVYNRKGCKKKSTRKDNIEQIVVDALIKAFKDAKGLAKLADDILAANKKRVENQSILTLLLKEKEQAEVAIENILAAIEKGVVTPSTTKRLQDMEAKVEKLNEQIAIEQSKERLTISKKDIITFISKTLKEEPEKLVKTLVKEIILYDDKIEIICNYIKGKTPDGTPTQGLLIYSDMVEMPYIINCSIYPTMKQFALTMYV